MSANILTSCHGSLLEVCQESGSESRAVTIGSDHWYEGKITVCIDSHFSQWVARSKELRISYFNQALPVTCSEILCLEAVERVCSCFPVICATPVSQCYLEGQLIMKGFGPWVMSSSLIWKYVHGFTGNHKPTTWLTFMSSGSSHCHLLYDLYSGCFSTASFLFGINHLFISPAKIRGCELKIFHLLSNTEGRWLAVIFPGICTLSVFTIRYVKTHINVSQWPYVDTTQPCIENAGKKQTAETDTLSPALSIWHDTMY